jgi:hypothetical protein
VESGEKHTTRPCFTSSVFELIRCYFESLKISNHSSTMSGLDGIIPRYPNKFPPIHVYCLSILKTLNHTSIFF